MRRAVVPRSVARGSQEINDKCPSIHGYISVMTTLKFTNPLTPNDRYRGSYRTANLY